ncbi:MAG: aspartate/glutamate racemase family protein [Paludibacteraceae bacterium]|nr:aspartate/glutamate racemase family protein [Paludibacteraceae bacterium]
MKERRTRMKIGVFDSGYGGLTILREIRRVLPEYDYLYLGDNARAPYGTHSFDVIYRYTLEAVRYLLAQDCVLVILACNTASAKALRTIQQKDLLLINGENGDASLNGEMRKRNVLGVIRPTVEAVPGITKTGHVGILGTPATVSSESYVLELEKIAEYRKMVITQQACPMWVPLIEAGEQNSDGADYFVEKYLREILEKDPQIDTLVLGCTHYPLLKEKIDRFADRIRTAGADRAQTYSPIRIIAQGELVAKSLADYLARHAEYREQLSTGGTCRYLTTENAERFAQTATQFLNTPIQAESIQLGN